MSAYTDLIAVTLTSGEQSAVAAASITGEDAAGTLASVIIQLHVARQQLARITANMGAGSNKTKLDAWVTAALV